MPSTRLLAPTLALFAAACTSSGDTSDRKLLAYDATDDCTVYADAEACAADAACEWFAIGACPDEGCPDGVCVAIDPCRGHSDAAACAADVDNACAWAESELLCPPGADCDSGRATAWTAVSFATSGTFACGIS